jgi:hypothetical protein
MQCTLNPGIELSHKVRRILVISYVVGLKLLINDAYGPIAINIFYDFYSWSITQQCGAYCIQLKDIYFLIIYILSFFSH